MKRNLVLTFCFLTSVSALAQQPLPNYDVRFVIDRRISWSPATLHREPFGEMKQAEARLKQFVPQLNVKYNAALGGPEIVGIKGGQHYLTPASNQDHERILREFLTANAAL